MLIHNGTNDTPTRWQTDAIAEDIIQLALKLKTGLCGISVSNTVVRNDQYRNKASGVNCKLKDLCKEKNLHYVDHSNSFKYKTFKWSKTPFKHKRYKDLIE